jgi:hypothetical protein
MCPASSWTRPRPIAIHEPFSPVQTCQCRGPSTTIAVDDRQQGRNRRSARSTAPRSSCWTASPAAGRPQERTLTSRSERRPSPSNSTPARGELMRLKITAADARQQTSRSCVHHADDLGLGEAPTGARASGASGRARRSVRYWRRGPILRAALDRYSAVVVVPRDDLRPDYDAGIRNRSQRNGRAVFVANVDLPERRRRPCGTVDAGAYWRSVSRESRPKVLAKLSRSALLT